MTGARLCTTGAATSTPEGDATPVGRVHARGIHVRGAAIGEWSACIEGDGRIAGNRRGLADELIELVDLAVAIAIAFGPRFVCAAAIECALHSRERSTRDQARAIGQWSEAVGASASSHPLTRELDAVHKFTDAILQDRAVLASGIAVECEAQAVCSMHG